MGFWGVIGAGWRGAFGAIKANPRLFGALLLANAVLELLVNLADPVHYVQSINTTAQPVMLPTMGTVHLVVHGAVFYLLFSVIAAPSMVAVHRHVLLEEDGKIWGNPPRLFVFAILFFGVRFVLFSLPALLIAVSYWFVLIFFVSFWLIGRLALTYPAAALDDSTPLANSWKYTGGHWWFVAGVMIFGLAPIMLVTTPFSVALTHATPETVGRLTNELVAISTITGLLYAIVGAGLASELFRKFGDAPVVG